MGGKPVHREQEQILAKLSKKWTVTSHSKPQERRVLRRKFQGCGGVSSGVSSSGVGGVSSRGVGE